MYLFSLLFKFNYKLIKNIGNNNENKPNKIDLKFYKMQIPFDN